MIAIRGATTCTENSREAILDATQDLLEQMFAKNNLTNDSLVDIFFTSTPDITAAYPAEAARIYGLTDVPLMGAQEIYVEGSPRFCIRVMIHADLTIPRKEGKHIYRRGAITLRPDLSSDNKEV